MSDFKKARQRQKVKRVGIHAAFTPDGKERSDKEIEAYNKANREYKPKKRGKKDNTKQRKRLDSAIERMSSGQSTNKANKRNYV